MGHSENLLGRRVKIVASRESGVEAGAGTIVAVGGDGWIYVERDNGRLSFFAAYDATEHLILLEDCE